MAVVGGARQLESGPSAALSIAQPSRQATTCPRLPVKVSPCCAQRAPRHSSPARDHLTRARTSTALGETAARRQRKLPSTASGGTTKANPSGARPRRGASEGSPPKPLGRLHEARGDARPRGMIDQIREGDFAERQSPKASAKREPVTRTRLTSCCVRAPARRELRRRFL